MKTILGLVRLWLSVLGRNKMFLVMLGGAVGSYLRYVLANWFRSKPWGQVFPFGTLFINVTGSFILGLAGGIILERLPPGRMPWYLLIGTGFCGGYTTFSTFSWETASLIRDGSWWLALANCLGSVCAGILGVFLALALVNLFFPRQ